VGGFLPSAKSAMNPHELAALNIATEVLRKHGTPLPTNHPGRCQHSGHTHEPIEPAGFRPVALEGDTSAAWKAEGVER
jgi:hypothetical protein